MPIYLDKGKRISDMGVSEEDVCPRCGCREPKTMVHGHYQCANCKCVADGDCCQGEVATEPRPTVQA